MIWILRHAYFKEPNEGQTTDERYETLAKRARAGFVISVCVVAACSKNPHLLVLAPTEHVISSHDRFTAFCSACVGFQWTALALGHATYGIAFVLMAAESTYQHGPTGLVFLLAWPIWRFTPFLFVLPLCPLIQRDWLAFALRLPIFFIFFSQLLQKRDDV